MSKYYVSKYAATKGIQEYDALNVLHTIGEDGVVESVSIGGKVFKFGNGLFIDLDDARRDAIQRTRKQVTKLFKKESSLEARITEWETELPQ